jgi:hypothetical protein
VKVDQLPYGIQIVQALGPMVVALVVAAIAGLIAYRQWKTAHDKLRLDLFDKRFNIYRAYFRASAAALGRWPDRHDVLAQFTSLKGQSKFLFGTEAAKFIEEAMLEIAGLISHQDTREEMRKAEQYDENLGNLILSLIEKIGEREKNAYATFEKYLSFATIHER